MTKQAQMQQIEEEVTNLTESPLYDYRTENGYLPVIGEGSLDAKIVFIGEAPGAKEAETGRPFCGASGKVLDELLASIGLDRHAVYITNVVKDRPPNNRDPHKKEIKLYTPFLARQLEIIQPAVIATLGRFSMEFVLTLYDAPEKTRKISELHGKVLEVGELKVLPLYHPAVALYNAGQKSTLFEDFEGLRQFLA